MTAPPWPGCGERRGREMTDRDNLARFTAHLMGCPRQASETATCQCGLDALTAQLTAANADCAAMRTALEAHLHVTAHEEACADCGDRVPCNDWCRLSDAAEALARAALTTTAGQPLLAVVQAAREWAWFYLEPLPPPSKSGDDEIARRIGRAQGALLDAVERLDGGHDAR